MSTTPSGNHESLKSKIQNARKRGPTPSFPARSNTTSSPIPLVSQTDLHSSRTTWEPTSSSDIPTESPIYGAASRSAGSSNKRFTATLKRHLKNVGTRTRSSIQSSNFMSSKCMASFLARSGRSESQTLRHFFHSHSSSTSWRHLKTGLQGTRALRGGSTMSSEARLTRPR